MNYHSGGIQGGELSLRICITNYLRIGKLQFRPVSDFGPQSCMQESIQWASCHSESAHTDRLHTSIKRAAQGNLTGSAKDCFYEVFGPGLRTPPIFSENDRSKCRGSDSCRRWSAEGWKRSVMKLCGLESLINLDLGSWCSWHHVHLLVFTLPI